MAVPQSFSTANTNTKIAVNVMRARLTVVGFNIAVVSFQMPRVTMLPGGINIPGIDHVIHANSQVALLLAMAISIATIVAYLYSSEYDNVGTCSSWSLIVGDILLYMALACTITGFFSPLKTSLDMVTPASLVQMEQFQAIKDALLVAGALSWFLAAYIGPIRAITRSPFPLKINIAITLGYLMLFSAIAWTLANATALDEQQSTSVSFVDWLTEFIQPLRW